MMSEPPLHEYNKKCGAYIDSLFKNSAGKKSWKRATGVNIGSLIMSGGFRTWYNDSEKEFVFMETVTTNKMERQVEVRFWLMIWPAAFPLTCVVSFDELDGLELPSN